MDKKTCSVPEMARVLGISKTTAYQLACTKGFPAFKVGNRTLVYCDGLDQWLKEQAEKGV